MALENYITKYVGRTNAISPWGFTEPSEQRTPKST
jgi:hypothetical protein